MLIGLSALSSIAQDIDSLVRSGPMIEIISGAIHFHYIHIQ